MLVLFETAAGYALFKVSIRPHNLFLVVIVRVLGSLFDDFGAMPSNGCLDSSHCNVHYSTSLKCVAGKLA